MQIGDYSSWRVGYNPKGDDLLLCADRGIVCENHTHILSYHCYNTPTLETVRIVAERNIDGIKSSISAFVDSVHSLQQAWDFKENVVILFMRHLLKELADAAETLENDQRLKATSEI